MKILLLSSFIASVFFLLIDMVWLSVSVKLFYKPQLGDLLNDKPVMWAAFLFYVLYVVGMAIIVIKPALTNFSINNVFWTGLLFGAVAYGTYNLTNMATIKNWSAYVVFVDIFWGGLLTGTSSVIGIYLAKKFIN